MNKQIKRLIVAAMMILALPMQIFAASEAAASIQANGNQASVSVSLQNQAAGEGVTALQMILDVQVAVGSLNQAQVGFTFNENLPGTIQRYSYNQEKHTLTIYVAGAKNGLFTNGSVDLGNISVTSNTGDYIKLSITTGDREDSLQILSGGTNLKTMSMQAVTANIEAGTVVVPTQPPQETSQPSVTATPTAKPSVTATPTAKPSVTATPTAKPSATATPTAKPSATAAPTAKPGATAAPTAKPGATAAPGATVAPGATAVPGTTAAPNEEAAISGTGEYTASDVEKAFKEQGGIVEFDVTNKAIVDAKAFALLKDAENTTLRLSGNGYTWNFKAADITDSSVVGNSFNSAIQFAVKDSIKQKIESFVEGNDYIAFETAYSGTLPGKATLELQLDKAAYAGKTLELYYQPENGDAELVSEVTADANGMVSLSLDHCSVYFLAIKTNNANADASQPVNATTSVVISESTSNVPVAGIVAIVLLVVVIAAVVVIRRRNGN